MLALFFLSVKKKLSTRHKRDVISSSVVLANMFFILPSVTVLRQTIAFITLEKNLRLWNGPEVTGYPFNKRLKAAGIIDI